MRRRYSVYRMDSRTGRKEGIGCIEERRKGERNTQSNYRGLLAEARGIFGEGPDERIDIEMDDRNEIQRQERIGDGEEEAGDGREDQDSVPG